MLDISTILNNETFTPEEQLEIIKYIDAQEIDRISERLPNTYIITNDDSN